MHLESFLLMRRPGNLIHLGCNLVEQGVAVFPNDIDVEVRSVREEREMRIASELIQCGLQAVCRAVQVERVVGADNQMNLAPEVGANGLPIPAQVFDDVVVTAPIGGYIRIDSPGDTVKDRLRPPIGPAGREDPFERSELTAIVSKHRLEPGKLLHGGTRLAVIAENRIRRAVRASIEICVRGIKIDGTEEMKVAGVGGR